MAARPVLQRVLTALDLQIRAPLDKSPFHEPCTRVVPAQQRLRDMARPGDFASVVQHLNIDPRSFHSGPEALLDRAPGAPG